MTLHHFFPWLTEADITAHQAGLQRMHSALNDDNERYRCSAHIALTDMTAEPAEWADILAAWLCGFYTVQADRVFGQLRDIYPQLRG